jgi:two-component system chemotaxis response regulator CheY
MFPSNTKILVIDDMRTMRMVVKNTLMKLGYTKIEEAEDGEAGLTKLKEADLSGEAFGLVLSDWNMPKMQGLELLKKVRSDAKLKGTPFLLITAESEQSQIMDAIKAGVDHYVTKPFTPETIKQKLLQVWEKKKKVAA